MIIRIKNLRLRTINGIFDWERKEKQDFIINVTLEFDEGSAPKTDRIEDTLDYKTLNKKIIEFVEKSQFFLLEKLADGILKLILEDSRVSQAEVEIDKPGALRFADSVSVQTRAKR